jgi:hypothetical protein
MEQLEATYRWAREVDLSGLPVVLTRATRTPLLAIGSGGSLSSACLIANLERHLRGIFASFETPLLASRNPAFLTGTRIFIVSARGRNPDALGFAKLAIAAEPVSVISLCCMKGSPLTNLVQSFDRGDGFEFASPAGKDGYLATNSLVALNTMIARAYGVDSNLPDRWGDLFDAARLRHSLSQMRNNASAVQSDEILLLFGPDTRPAAVDFESKFHESGLANVQVTDYRNFAHGRHLWIAQRPSTTVILFISQNDRAIAESTLKLLPRPVRAIKVETSFNGIAAAFAMQAAVFEIVSAYGGERGSDPGRPMVPVFGRKLYRLNVFPAASKAVHSASISRKQRARALVGLPELSKAGWEDAYKKFRENISALRFTQCVLDYDGTICDHKDRFVGITDKVTESLVSLLDGGFPLGIATGRGKSVREALRAALPKRLWHLVTVAFYNGGIVLPLSNSTGLDTGKTQATALSDTANIIREANIPGIKLTERAVQVTLELADAASAEPLWSLTSALLAKAQVTNVRVVASSRSVDIIAAGTSKLNVLKSMPGSAPSHAKTLFIGDKPLWPGNDFELLCQPGSLSVDEVGFDLETGWNMAPAGITGSAALVHYFGQIRKSSKHFRLVLRES